MGFLFRFEVKGEGVPFEAGIYRGLDEFLLTEFCPRLQLYPVGWDEIPCKYRHNPEQTYRFFFTELGYSEYGWEISEIFHANEAFQELLEDGKKEIVMVILEDKSQLTKYMQNYIQTAIKVNPAYRKAIQKFPVKSIVDLERLEEIYLSKSTREKVQAERMML